MKTNTFKYFGLALMAILMVSFTSCEVEIDSFYDDDNNGAGYYNRSADLCSRTWVVRELTIYGWNILTGQ